jgi:hypothetical protein
VSDEHPDTRPEGSGATEMTLIQKPGGATHSKQELFAGISTRWG